MNRITSCEVQRVVGDVYKGFGADEVWHGSMRHFFLNLYIWFRAYRMFNALSLMAGKEVFDDILKRRNPITMLVFVSVMQLALSPFGGCALSTFLFPVIVWCKIIALVTIAAMVSEVLRFKQRCVFSRVFPSVLCVK